MLAVITVCFTGLAGSSAPPDLSSFSVFVLSFPGWFSITLFRNTLSTEYAFPLLATTLALEAVLLTSCVADLPKLDRPYPRKARLS
jgi:hypothetical protein